MTQSQDIQVQVLDHIHCINLSISVWSARKKMSAADLGGSVELPPDELASLGSKRMCDPADLKIFGTLKSRVVSFLDRHGVRFLGGWAIPSDQVDEVLNYLTTVKGDFTAAKERFLADYDANVADWISRFPNWQEALQNSIVNPDYVRSRFRFSWQTFQVVSKTEDIHPDSGLQEELAGLGGQLFHEIAGMAKESWRTSYQGKDVVSQRALNCFDVMKEKLKGLSFIDPKVSPVVDMLETMLGMMPAEGKITGAQLLMLQGVLSMLMNPEQLYTHAQAIMDGVCQVEDVVSNLGLTKSPDTDAESSMSIAESATALPLQMELFGLPHASEVKDSPVVERIAPPTVNIGNLGLW